MACSRALSRFFFLGRDQDFLEIERLEGLVLTLRLQMAAIVAQHEIELFEFQLRLSEAADENTRLRGILNVSFVWCIFIEVLFNL